ncbi:hypothetical protein CROQUDRAFT_131645 [Cronartium quercuum f. sp. fusiforme G11]|uniref:Uncharacterized protein n=1 Tax=Cronartium quercuum f. sp. fusiforme G11 TaxID=708437 RepID=A0A9P6TFN1_9BASI|nr:hypothetical protein CROQUDRAFT_131645 [Cronartium quercuum f. sp. fusiforme G11]
MLDKLKVKADEKEKKSEAGELAVQTHSDSVIYWSNGIHNEKAKHSRDEFDQLHPEKHPIQFKKKAYIPKSSASATSYLATPSLNCTSLSSGSFAANTRALTCCATIKSNSKLLYSACSDDMMSDCDAFSTYQEI